MQLRCLKSSGVHIKTLYRWCDEPSRDGERAFLGKGKVTPADAELREMHCRIKGSEEESEISIKRIGHFPKTQNSKNEV